MEGFRFREGSKSVKVGGRAPELNLPDDALRATVKIAYPKGSCTQYLGTWDLGNTNCNIGFG